MATISTAQQLTDALSAGTSVLNISGRITGMPSLKLPEGATLCGVTDDAELAFGAKGLQLTAHNTVSHLTISTSVQELAIFNSDDGSIGIQVSKPLPSLTVKRDLTTVGGEGLILVRGVQVTLQAIALSIKNGGELDSIEVGGEISTSGDNVPAIESAGSVKAFAATAVRATGAGADAVRYRAGSLPLDRLALYTRDGEQAAEL